MRQLGPGDTAFLSEARHFIYNLCSVVADGQLAVHAVKDRHDAPLSECYCDLRARRMGTWCGYSASFLSEYLSGFGYAAVCLDLCDSTGEFTHVVVVAKCRSGYLIIDPYLNMSSWAYASVYELLSAEFRLNCDSRSNFNKFCISTSPEWSSYGARFVEQVGDISTFVIRFDPAEFLANFPIMFRFDGVTLVIPSLRPFCAYGDGPLMADVSKALEILTPRTTALAS